MENYKLLTNREISILIWTLLIFLFLILKSKGSFDKLLTVIKAIFSKKIIPFYFAFIVYFCIIISFLNKFSVWEPSLYKDFVYWFFTTGIVLFFNSTAIKSYGDFSKIILSVI